MRRIVAVLFELATALLLPTLSLSPSRWRGSIGRTLNQLITQQKAFDFLATYRVRPRVPVVSRIEIDPFRDFLAESRAQKKTRDLLRFTNAL